jgi:hypothetical protein
MAYCEETDLLISSDIMLPSVLSKSKFIQFAADDMDAKLGYVYIVPITTASLPAHQKSLLRSINAKLATGRLIMAAAVGGEDTAVHQYALYLIKEAEMDLMSIANGQVDLQAPAVDSSGNPLPPMDDPLSNDSFARTPGGWNPDRTSAVTAFEKSVFGFNDPISWDPATNISSDGGVSELR